MQTAEIKKNSIFLLFCLNLTKFSQKKTETLEFEMWPTTTTYPYNILWYLKVMMLILQVDLNFVATPAFKLLTVFFVPFDKIN